MKALYIAAWNDVYETAETRKIRTLTYYAKPNKLVGEGIGLTLAQPDNVALLGTWTLIEALASTSVREHRGYLVRNGTALTAERMSALTHGRVNCKTFERAIEHFLQPGVAWLTWCEVPGTSPNENAVPPATGALPGESPGSLPAGSPVPPATGALPGGKAQEEGKTEGRKKGEEEETPPPALLSPVPSLLEVRSWAASTGPDGVDPDFAELKYHQAEERGDFEKKTWQRGWRSKLQRFWREDGPAWFQEGKKNGAAQNGRPNGWKNGDQEFWWTDSLEELRGVLTGAVLQQQGKTAARLREIIHQRERKS